MTTKIRNGYLSPQVWVAKREQKGIEVLGRLLPARVEYAENIFAGEKYMENGVVKRDYSLLTVVIYEGKGESRKKVLYNFGPNDIFALRRECEPSINYGRSYSKSSVKRNCRNGEIKIRTVTITYERYQKDKNGNIKRDKNGNQILSNYPWFIGISEESGKADKDGKRIIDGKERVQSYIQMSSEEYQSMLDSTCRYIDVFAMAFGVGVLREKAKIAKQKQEEHMRNYGK